MTILQTENLSKKYGDTLAVNGVSIHVQKGEIYGFLGLNGAGKTTTIRMLLGLIKPDTGTCELFGKNPIQATNIWNKVGYLIETPHSYPNLSVLENLEVIYKLRGLNDKNLINQITGKLHLNRYKHIKAQNLSLGNKQRLGLAKALMHEPKLLILDEPVNSLDPSGIVEIRELLKDLAETHQATIFLSSHNLSEIAKLTNRIGIIHQGILIKELKTDELEKQLIKKLQVTTNDNDKAYSLLLEKGYNAVINNDFIEIMDKEAINKPEAITTRLFQIQLPVKSLQVYEEDLESYFLRAIREMT